MLIDFQNAMRGPPGPMGMTGLPGPVVSIDSYVAVLTGFLSFYALMFCDDYSKYLGVFICT